MMAEKGKALKIIQIAIIVLLAQSLNAASSHYKLRMCIEPSDNTAERQLVEKIELAFDRMTRLVVLPCVAAKSSHPSYVLRLSALSFEKATVAHATLYNEHNDTVFFDERQLAVNDVVAIKRFAQAIAQQIYAPTKLDTAELQADLADAWDPILPAVVPTVEFKQPYWLRVALSGGVQQWNTHRFSTSPMAAGTLDLRLSFLQNTYLDVQASYLATHFAVESPSTPSINARVLMQLLTAKLGLAGEWRLAKPLQLLTGGGMRGLYGISSAVMASSSAYALFLNAGMIVEAKSDWIWITPSVEFWPLVSYDEVPYIALDASWPFGFSALLDVRVKVWEPVFALVSAEYSQLFAGAYTQAFWAFRSGLGLSF